MNISKVAIALIIFVSIVESRPGNSESMLLFTRADYIRMQLTNKAAFANTAVLKHRIKNAKLRAALLKMLNQQADSQNKINKASNNANNKSSNKASSRMNRFRRYHN